MRNLAAETGISVGLVLFRLVLFGLDSVPAAADPADTTGTINGAAPSSEPRSGAAAGTKDGDKTKPNMVDMVCQTVQSAAATNDLPPDFLTRLIWQESRFNAHAVSRAGAQGIAQFMPGTAAWVGLANPFDAATAIEKSAVLLRNLKRQFGNLGLAAAAYNAGPHRVADWLAKRRALPAETRAYIRIVTGHAADEWSVAALRAASLDLPPPVPCPEIAKLFTGPFVPAAPAKPAIAALASAPEPAWGVQLVGGPSQALALNQFRQMQKTYQSVLGAREPLVLRTSAGRNASWYRVRVAANSLGEAEKLCSSLRAVGGSCLVQRN